MKMNNTTTGLLINGAFELLGQGIKHIADVKNNQIAAENLKLQVARDNHAKNMDITQKVILGVVATLAPIATTVIANKYMPRKTATENITRKDFKVVGEDDDIEIAL